MSLKEIKRQINALWHKQGPIGPEDVLLLLDDLVEELSKEPRVRRIGGEG